MVINVVPIVLGLVAFGFIAVAEYVSQRPVGLLKPFLWLGCAVCFALAYVLGWIDTPRFAVSPGWSLVAWVLTFVFGALFVYSAFLEVPFKASYLTRSDHPTPVTSGTYALTRHPGVIWNAIYSIAIALASGSWTLVVAAPFWILANIGCVWLEEKVNLEKAFGIEYTRYQESTPLLVPNRTSLLRFLREIAPWALKDSQESIGKPGQSGQEVEN